MELDCIYLDNHSTTRCDPRVVQAITPMLESEFGNIHSDHAVGRAAREHYEHALGDLAHALGAESQELVLTSGATESNNLAILGVALHPRQKRRHVITVETEHPAVLDPIDQLEASGFRVTRLPVQSQDQEQPGSLRLDQLREALDEDTCLVSVMAGNNEMGTLHSLAPIAELCHRFGALLHTDATQALGRLPLDVEALDVDLLSLSAHKGYGPKGVGLLFVRRRGRRVRLKPLMWGGGQQSGLRSGTVNSAGAVALAACQRVAQEEQAAGETQRIAQLVARLWQHLQAGIPGVLLNGPPLGEATRLLGNLNVCFPDVEGEALMSAVPRIAVSSGSACSTVDPRPSHVLLALGLSESAARRSLRFGVGRFNTEAEIDAAAEWLVEAHAKLRARYR